jgi:hypothetical protein
LPVTGTVLVDSGEQARSRAIVARLARSIATYSVAEKLGSIGAVAVCAGVTVLASTIGGSDADARSSGLPAEPQPAITLAPNTASAQHHVRPLRRAIRFARG